LAVEPFSHLPVLNSLNPAGGVFGGPGAGGGAGGALLRGLSFVIMTFGDLSEPPVGYSDIESTMVMRYILRQLPCKPFLFDWSVRALLNRYEEETFKMCKIPNVLTTLRIIMVVFVRVSLLFSPCPTAISRRIGFSPWPAQPT
jgi:hypothetical protein